MSVKSIIKELSRVNYKKSIKIRIRELPAGGYSVYLDLWTDGRREYFYPKIRLQGTVASVKEDEELFRLAVAVRDQKEIELIHQTAGFTMSGNSGKESNFVEYFADGF